MKILISDKLSDEGKKILEKRSLAYDERTGLSEDELKDCIGDYEAIVIRSGTKLKREIIEKADRLKVIGRAGVGVDNVDIEAATQKGIVVMNTPGGNTISTAQHTFTMLLALSRNIPQAVGSVKGGEWKKSKFAGVEVTGKTLGIIGIGRIGTYVAKYAQAFQMKVIGYDPYMSVERAEQLNIELVDLDELFRRSDYITVHTPLTDETKGIVGKSAFEKMKKGVRILNCARGGIVDEHALIEAIESGKVAGAALDVFAVEPPVNNRLLEFDNVIATPHLGASTKEAQENVAIDIANQVADFFESGRIQNAVNLPSIDEKLYEQLRPYISLSEKLGSFTAQMIKGRIRALEIICSGHLQEFDVGSITREVLKGFLGHILEDTINYVNAPLKAKERGIKVVESKSADTEDFASLVKIIAKTEKGEFSIAGTVFGIKHDPRIVRINNYHVDAHPYGCLIYILNRDKPGAIGKIGTTLGNNGVNIADMTLGRKKEGENAVVVLNIDGTVPEKAASELEELDEVIEVKVIKL